MRSNGTSAESARRERHARMRYGTVVRFDRYATVCSRPRYADPARGEAERDRDRGEHPVHDLEARALVLARHDEHRRSTRRASTRTPRPAPTQLFGSAFSAQRAARAPPHCSTGSRLGGRSAHVADGTQRDARSIASSGGSTAAADAFVIGSRRSGVAMRPWACSTPLKTAGLGSAKPARTTGSSASACARPSSSLPGEPALDHRDDALGADVRRRRDRAGAAHAHDREQDRILAAEHREPARRFGEHLQRVGVERADRLLHAGDVRMRGELEQRSRRRGRARCGTGCCRARSAPGSRRRPPACARRCRLRTAARSTARRRARRRRRRSSATAFVAAIVVRVLLVPVPTISGACAAAHARAHASMTARFSSSSSALASPVVPSATMPVAPAARYSWHRRSIAATSTAPSASNGVISGTQTPRRSRSLVMRKGVARSCLIACAAHVRTCCSSSCTMLVGVLTGILSGMFGVGGAVVSTPAVRALGATPLEAVGSTLPSILPSSISGHVALPAAKASCARASSLWTCVFGVPASVGGLAAVRRRARATATC